MKNKILKSKLSYFVILGALVLFAGCKSDIVDNGFTSSSNLNADFTVTTVSANKFTLTSSNNNYILSQWDLDDGGGYYEDNNTVTIFLPDAGTYNVKHRVMGAGGVFSDVVTQTITVAASDPNAGNLVQGGKFTSNDDIAKWTVLNPTNTDATVTFGDGKALIKATGWAGNGVFQAINLEAGKTYKVDMVCSSTSGCINTWFEVYCGYSNPAGNTDYNEGGIIANINTWAGSGTAAFSGKLSAVGSATDMGGMFTASTTGTAYLVIRAGGENMQDGIAFTNVELRGVSE